MSAPSDVVALLRDRHPEIGDEVIQEVGELVALIRKTHSLPVVEMALDIATGEGDVWPQCEAGYPNPAAALMFAHLLARHTDQARAALRVTPLREFIQ